MGDKREICNRALSILLGEKFTIIFPAFSTTIPAFISSQMTHSTCTRPPGGPRRHRQGTWMGEDPNRPAGIKDFGLTAAPSRLPATVVCLRQDVCHCSLGTAPRSGLCLKSQTRKGFPGSHLSHLGRAASPFPGPVAPFGVSFLSLFFSQT